MMSAKEHSCVDYRHVVSALGMSIFSREMRVCLIGLDQKSVRLITRNTRIIPCADSLILSSLGIITYDKYGLYTLDCNTPYSTASSGVTQLQMLRVCLLNPEDMPSKGALLERYNAIIREM